MKRTVLTLFSLSLCLIGLSILFSSSSSGRAFAANSGNTGAPGEPSTCGSCHSGGSFSATSYIIELLDSSNNVVSSYTPGIVYTLRGTFTTPVGSPMPSRYGFQVVSLIGTNTVYNAWSSPSPNARVASAFNGRSYTEQRGPSTSNTFSVHWTAPPVGSGDVNFYSASNAVNFNRTTSGDNGFTDQITITENISTNTSELSDEKHFSVYPNPVVDQLFIEKPNKTTANLMIFDQNGRLVQEELLIGRKAIVSMEQLAEGIYFIRLTNAFGLNETTKVIKN